jgi:hypothetical protein
MAMADGAVRFVRDSIDPEAYRAAGSRDAQEPVGGRGGF